ncbi:ATP-binding protein [Kitasatospora sp. NPDC056138]|uniref:ATP-binding protein n=1 Tax=Kitasatospora sp. NPDC056138 TaxID=3345724 RepID=UPI0035D680E0
MSGAAEPATRPLAEDWQEGEPGLPVEGVWRFSAVAHEASVPQTRHAVRDRLLAQGLAAERYQELVDDVLLIVSELVGNAVTHAAVLSPHLTTELAIEDGWVRISVEDGHPHRPKALESDQGQLGGRGLLLVKSVTLQAGGVCDVECTGEGGKVIWASLPLPAAPGARTAGQCDSEHDGEGGEAGGGAAGGAGPAGAATVGTPGFPAEAALSTDFAPQQPGDRTDPGATPCPAVLDGLPGGSALWPM